MTFPFQLVKVMALMTRRDATVVGLL